MTRDAVPPGQTDLDTTPTASIGPAAAGRAASRSDEPAAPNAAPVGSKVIQSATVEVATERAATITIGGRVRTVRVGDEVPGAGAVVAINAGPHPSVKTTRGMILSRDD